MNDQHDSEIKSQCFGLSHKTQWNVLDDLRQYRQLDSAIGQGQRKIIDSLLDAGAPVNFNFPGHCSKLRTPLHSSVRFGNPEIVEKLLDRGACVNAKYLCDTPLTLAAKLGKHKIVDILLRAKGLEICFVKELGQINHFHIACMRNQVNVVKNLLEYEHVNAAVAFKSDYWPGFTPLHFAVQFQNMETVEFLLSVGADITIKDARQCTPLHLADLLRNEKIIDMILATHVERIATNPVNSKGLSHFHIACSRNKPGIVSHFLNLGVDLQASSFDEKLNGWNYETALELAIQFECTDVVRLLLPYRSSDFVSTRLFGFIEKAYCTGNMEIVELLTTSFVSQETRKTEPSLLMSCTGTHIESIENWLSQTPSALNVPITTNGRTLLHVAIEHKSVEICKFLLDRGANYTIQDAVGKSPLHLAFQGDMEYLVDSMLKRHEEYLCNPIDNDGLSHLHIACARKYENAVKLLLKIGADVNSPVNSNALFWSGYTPLHFAVKFGSEKAARILLEHGANYSAMNGSNLSPFDNALIIAHTNPNDIKSDSRFCLMKLILTHHLQCKNIFFNDHGFSLLHLACIHFFSSDLSTYERFVEVVKTHACDINKTVSNSNTSWDGFTPLHFAVQYASTRDQARFLIKMGANILKPDSNGNTPIHLSIGAMVFSELKVDPQDLRYLQLNHIGTEGYSIFHIACAQGNLDLMKYFLEYGVDANGSSFNLNLGCKHSTPLHLTILENSDSSGDAVKLLLNYGADPNQRDYTADTPLHLMRLNSRSEIVDALVSHGANVNAPNAVHETPLLSLCVELVNTFRFTVNHYDCILSFLSNGADINIANERGETPLSLIRNWEDVDDRNESYEFSIAINIVGILLKHAIKLETLGYNMSKTEKEHYSSLLSHFSDRLHFIEESFIEKCIDELELMKQVHTDRYTSLYNIIFESPNKLAVTSQNSVFQQIVELDDFPLKYPIYGYLLKLRLRQGQVRWPLLNESVESLHSVLGFKFPRVCYEKIVQYLDDRDLRNIIISKEKL